MAMSICLYCVVDDSMSLVAQCTMLPESVEKGRSIEKVSVFAFSLLCNVSWVLRTEFIVSCVSYQHNASTIRYCAVQSTIFCYSLSSFSFPFALTHSLSK
jgi:hypothetical protein